MWVFGIFLSLRLYLILFFYVLYSHCKAIECIRSLSFFVPLARSYVLFCGAFVIVFFCVFQIITFLWYTQFTLAVADSFRIDWSFAWSNRTGIETSHEFNDINEKKIANRNQLPSFIGERMSECAYVWECISLVLTLWMFAWVVRGFIYIKIICSKNRQ